MIVMLARVQYVVYSIFVFFAWLRDNKQEVLL